MKTIIKKLNQNLLTLVLVGMFMLAGKNANAQQELLTTQWAYNKLTVNPAYAGGKDMFSARALHRQQWVGIDGRPITTVLNAHSPFLRDRMAIGLTIANDRLGVMKTNLVTMSYAYRLPFERNDSKLSFGLNFGFESSSINGSNLELVQLNDVISQVNYRKISPKVGAGIYYYGKKFFVGVSSPNLVPNKIYKVKGDPNDNVNSKQTTHLYFMGGYAFEFAEGDFVLKPQALFKTVFGNGRKAPWQADFNLSMVIKQRFIIGSTIRTTIGNKSEGIDLEKFASADVMAGFYITKQFLVSYAYDFTLGDLNNYDSGSHEIMLGFDFDFRRTGIHTPRYF